MSDVNDPRRDAHGFLPHEQDRAARPHKYRAHGVDLDYDVPEYMDEDGAIGFYVGQLRSALRAKDKSIDYWRSRAAIAEARLTLALIRPGDGQGADWTRQ